MMAALRNVSSWLHHKSAVLNCVKCRNVNEHLILNKKENFRRYLTFQSRRNHLKTSKFPFDYWVRKNSTQSEKSSTGASGLADELLASRIKKDEGKESGGESETAKEERERTWKALKFSFLFVGGTCLCFGGYMIAVYGAPLVDESGKVLTDRFSDKNIVLQYLGRTWQEMKLMTKAIQEPSRLQLLPDTLKDPYFQPPYTLVLELRDILVHPEHTHTTGWRFKKRPGIEFLLQHCGPPIFEIVVYTADQGFTAFPLIDKLDPQGMIWYRLFKDATRYVDGKHMKDLHCLNRDLNKVIMVDWDKDAVTSPRNLLKIPRWNGDTNDQMLIDLAMMLSTIAESEIDDVREVLDYYSSFDDPLAAFKENQRVALVEKDKKVQEIQKSVPLSGWGLSTVSSFLRRR